MPKGQPFPIHIQQEILLRFDAHRRTGLPIMEACEAISTEITEMSIPPGSVWAVLQRLRPTTDIAKMYLKAKAMKLARRIVKRASPAEAMDLLSRPGMGVIEPRAGNESGGPSGFFLSVQADTCGAVKVGIATGPVTQAALEEGQFDPFAGAVGGFHERETVSQAPARRLIGQSATAQSVLERARAKIRDSQRAGDAGVSQFDGEIAAEG